MVATAYLEKECGTFKQVCSGIVNNVTQCLIALWSGLGHGMLIA